MPELFARILSGSPAPLSASVPAALRDVIERCLERDPARRYQHAREVRAALAAIERGTGSPLAVWRRRLRRRPALAASAAALVAAGLVVANVDAVRERLGLGQAEATSLRLAVLPFENLTGNPAQDFLSDGLTEEMITQLGRMDPRLSVVARTSSMRYKGTALPPREIARELGVDYLLEGSARREGNRVRISATLIDARAQTQRWSQTFDRELSGILTLQQDAARGVADALALALFPAEQARLATERPVDPDAHADYLRGLVYWTSGDFDTALELFELARRRAADHPLPYIGIARVWLSRAQSGIVPPAEAVAPIRAALETALSLDPTVPEAHFAEAAVAAWLEWDWSRADAAFRRAIDANPSYAEARAFYAHYLHIVGRGEEAPAHIELAVQLDPFNPLIRALYGVERTMNRRYEEALVQFERARELAPTLRLALNNFAQVYHSLGRYKEALEAERRFWTTIGASDIAELLAREYAAGGYERAMEAAADALAARPGERNVASVHIATLYTRAGRTERAVDWLERAYDARDLNVPYIRAVSVTEPLRDHPRFRALVRRLNLPE
ncbi:MAG TPA: tetratricopeptide repeat protein [Gammaproteobacteria bacterium]